jgi:DnaJ-class molecular chaperone
MSLKDYAVNRDKFELRKDGRHALSLDFPCCHCSYCFKAETDEPCRTCDHNVNAVKDPPPVPSDQSPCSSCGGYGVVSLNPDTPPNPAIGGSTVECTRCNGTGESSDEDRHEKSESRAGIPPFEVRGPTNH